MRYFLESLPATVADPTDPSTRARELRALHEAMREAGLSETTTVTIDDDFTEDAVGGSIHALPAWRRLLEDTPG